MVRVAVIPNKDKANSCMIAKDVIKILLNNSIKPVVTEDNFFLSDAVDIASGENIYKNIDIVICIGGDGTIIHTSKFASKYGVPILGVNAGRVGFLASIEANEIELLARLKNRNFSLQRRFMLKTQLNSECTVYCLNDFVISKGVISRMLDFSVKLSNDTIDYRADGLIVATPTGSTAYSMSAGGPVLEPTVQSIVLTPICPHSLFSRSIVVDSNTDIQVFSKRHNDTELFLTIDGEGCYQLDSEFNLNISVAKDRFADIVVLKKHSFFRRLSDKIQ